MSNKLIVYSDQEVLINKMKTLLTTYALTSVQPPVIKIKDPILSAHVQSMYNVINTVNNNANNLTKVDLSYFTNYQIGDDIKEILYLKTDESIQSLMSSYCTCNCNYCSCNCARCSCNCARCSCNCDDCYM